MSSRPERHAATEASLLPVPHLKRTAVLTGLAALALLLAVHAVGMRKPAWHVTGDWWGPFEGLFAFVMQCVAGVARLVTIGKDGAPLSVRFGCLLLLLLTFVFWRRWMLARNAHRPGPVDVQKLVASSPEVEQELEGLTAQLRKYLSETNLYPPSALPAETPAENFIDLLGDVDLEPKKFGTSLLRLFSRLRPKVAYTVRGVLRARTREPRCGMTITVTSYAMRGSRTETLWGDTWDDVVRSGGNWVMAAIVPVTRAGRRPPWQEWHGRDLDPELFAAYQEGRRLSRERKFDDALDRYYAALRLDPSNLYLRTQIAGIQEKLWLHLDALETYYGAMLLDGCTNRQREQRLAMRYGDPRRFFRRRYRWWSKGLLEARYRYAVVLGVGEQTARQWCVSSSDNGHFPRRACARDQIRAAMAPAFADRYWRAFRGWTSGRTEATERERITAWLMEALQEERATWLVRLIFQRACLEEMRQLARDSPWATLLPFVGARHRGTLTRASLRLNVKVWAPLRLSWAYYERDGPRGQDGKIRPLAAASSTPAWIGDVRTLDQRVQHLLDRPIPHWLKRRLPRPRRPWQDSYNAACVYAAAMGHPAFSKDDERLAALAVEELEDAARTGRSGSYSLRRSWLLIQDPDLTELRRSPRFIRFERETYPHAFPDHKRPEKPVAAELRAYHRRLLQNAARVMEHTWRDRGNQLLTGADTVAHWFSSDREAWECVYQLVRNGGNDWRDRQRLLRVIRDIAVADLPIRHGLPPGLPELDDLLDEASWADPAGGEDLVVTTTRTTEERLEHVRWDLEPDEREAEWAPELSPIRRSEEWYAAVRKDQDVSRLPTRRAAWQVVCRDYECAWRALDDQLDPYGDPAALLRALNGFRRPRRAAYGLTAAEP